MLSSPESYDDTAENDCSSDNSTNEWKSKVQSLFLIVASGGMYWFVTRNMVEKAVSYFSDTNWSSEVRDKCIVGYLCHNKENTFLVSHTSHLLLL